MARRIQPSKGFPPVAGCDARILILGSLPGQMSLQKRQYYAQPRNAFWPLMARLLNGSATTSYEARTSMLVEHRIALWDVCATAVRPGSLDAAIRRDSVVANKFAAFFNGYVSIELICFNGQKAADLYRRLVAPTLPGPAARLATLTLPSTSPAHASQSFAEKLCLWQRALQLITLNAP